ncbi:beta-lactamase family protein [Planotetraspora sp. A-T 1434]|uniref:serine hydrolase domain-containing protein n=1 Tax=Planotetraspora sp. A-T 1434 TaxID=2979219 RepID=UPI0021BF9BC9|nr:serine hydrolase domain-containing protein [Planotetraspora sp. A-T 1434]MCT9932341.1 beta-lactamase family protein [Planotetraspora sp. A-T 1434]
MTTLSRRSLLKAGVGAVPALALGAAPARAADVLVSGVAPAALAGLDQVMKTYVAERDISCAQLAVVKNGKIVLARGYGYYTRPTTTGGTAFLARVQPTSLFRIASLSKHITATAVMRLVQDGKLSLSAPVTTLLGLSATADSRLKNVTVLRLMQHLGGWDRDVSKDQLWLDHTISASLGVPLPISHADIIKYATGRPLDFQPGSKMVYSNYGYTLLGRIIEKVSGMSYEAYVKQKLLTPIGISRMRLGLSLRTEAAAGEVTYYSQYTNKTVMDGSGTVVPYQYGGFNMPNQDANGGWLASAVDLVKFSTVFDAAGKVLNAASIATMFAKPEIGISDDGSWYGCGWYVRQVPGHLNTWHAGGMPGTYTYLARIQNGVTYAALFNRREESGTPDYDVLSPRMNEAIGKVTTWPTTDLTSKYF